jgi:hypothetical protein
MENRLLKTYLKMQGPDGLIYNPIKGRPWALPEKVEVFGGIDFIPEGDYWCSFIMSGKILGAFCIYALKDPSGPWRDAAFRLARGLMDQCIVEGDIAYLARLCTEPGLPLPESPEKPIASAVAMSGWIAEGLVQCALSLGFQEAGEMGTKLLRYTIRDSGYFLEDGEFTRETNFDLAHFQAHTMQIHLAMEVFRLTGDEEFLKFAKKAYNYAIRHGEPLVGFFPECIGDTRGEASEICEVADMISIGLKLSLLGQDEWDNVDRWVRNQFAECQLTTTNWITDGHVEKVDREKHELFQAGCDIARQEYGTTDRVAERAVGSFCSRPSPNDIVLGPDWSIFHCCTGNGARAIYYVWEKIVTWHEETLRVNLLLNRASPWVDVKSHIPYQGRVDVEVKEDLDLEIRLPEWVEPREAMCTVNGNDRELDFVDRYARVGDVSKGDEVIFEFPIFERLDRVTIWHQEYMLVRRGNDVVWIDPPGKNCPLYQNDHYRRGKTLCMKVERFISDLEIPWG